MSHEEVLHWRAATERDPRLKQLRMAVASLERDLEAARAVPTRSRTAFGVSAAGSGTGQDAHRAIVSAFGPRAVSPAEYGGGPDDRFPESRPETRQTATSYAESGPVSESTSAVAPTQASAAAGQEDTTAVTTQLDSAASSVTPSGYDASAGSEGASVDEEGRITRTSSARAWDQPAPARPAWSTGTGTHQRARPTEPASSSGHRPPLARTQAQRQTCDTGSQTQLSTAHLEHRPPAEEAVKPAAHQAPRPPSDAGPMDGAPAEQAVDAASASSHGAYAGEEAALVSSHTSGEPLAETTGSPTLAGSRSLSTRSSSRGKSHRPVTTAGQGTATPAASSRAQSSAGGPPRADSFSEAGSQSTSGAGEGVVSTGSQTSQDPLFHAPATLEAPPAAASEDQSDEEESEEDLEQEEQQEVADVVQGRAARSEGGAQSTGRSRPPTTSAGRASRAAPASRAGSSRAPTARSRSRTRSRSRAARPVQTRTTAAQTATVLFATQSQALLEARVKELESLLLALDVQPTTRGRTALRKQHGMGSPRAPGPPGTSGTADTTPDMSIHRFIRPVQVGPDRAETKVCLSEEGHPSLQLAPSPSLQRLIRQLLLMDRRTAAEATVDRWGFLVAQYRTWRAVESLKASLAARQEPRARVRAVTRPLTRQWGQRVEQYALRAHLHRMRRERVWSQSMRCFVALTNRANEEATSGITPAGAQPRARIQRLDLLLAEAFPLQGPIVPRPPTPEGEEGEDPEPDSPRRPPSTGPRTESEASRPSTAGGDDDEGPDPNVFLTTVSGGDGGRLAAAEAVQDGTVEAVREEAASLVAHAAPAAPVDAHSRAPSALVRSRAESRKAGREGTATAEERPAVAPKISPPAEAVPSEARDRGRLPQRPPHPRPPVAGNAARIGLRRVPDRGAGEEDAAVPPEWQRRRAQHMSLGQQHLQRLNAVLPFLPPQLRDVPAPVLVQSLAEVCEYVMAAGDGGKGGAVEADPKPEREQLVAPRRRRRRPLDQPPMPRRAPAPPSTAGPAAPAAGEPRPPWVAVGVDMRSQAKPPPGRPGPRGGTVRVKARVHRHRAAHASPMRDDDDEDAQRFVPLQRGVFATADAAADAGTQARPFHPDAPFASHTARASAPQHPAERSSFLPNASTLGGAKSMEQPPSTGGPLLPPPHQQRPAETRGEEGGPATQPAQQPPPSSNGRMGRPIWIPGLAVPPPGQEGGEGDDVRQWASSLSPPSVPPESAMLPAQASAGSERGARASGQERGPLPVSAHAGVRPRSVRFEEQRQRLFETHSITK